jgi:hypothetical protein
MKNQKSTKFLVEVVGAGTVMLLCACATTATSSAPASTPVGGEMSDSVRTAPEVIPMETSTAVVDRTKSSSDLLTPVTPATPAVANAETSDTMSADKGKEKEPLASAEDMSSSCEQLATQHQEQCSAVQNAAAANECVELAQSMSQSCDAALAAAILRSSEAKKKIETLKTDLSEARTTYSNERRAEHQLARQSRKATQSIKREQRRALQLTAQEAKKTATEQAANTPTTPSATSK